MGTLIVFIWMYPLGSRRRQRGAGIDPVQDEFHTAQFVDASLRPWYTSAVRADDVRLPIRPYLHNVIWISRAVHRDFNLSFQDYARRCQVLATRVCAALLVMESVHMPGVPQCLMCESLLPDRETPRTASPTGVNMLSFTSSSNPTGAWPWILDEILVYPEWQVDSPPTLCASHAAEFRSALESVAFGCARLPPRSPARRPSLVEAMQVGPSS